MILNMHSDPQKLVEKQKPYPFRINEGHLTCSTRAERLNFAYFKGFGDDSLDICIRHSYKIFEASLILAVAHINER
jgi:hypothetical protein